MEPLVPFSRCYTGESDANETSGELGLSLLDGLVDQNPEILANNRIIQYGTSRANILIYINKWCDLKSPSVRASIVILRWSTKILCMYFLGSVDVGNDHLCVEQ